MIFLVFCIINGLYSTEVCKFNFDGCPEDYHGDTIIVPEKIIALSQDVFVCEPTEIIEDGIDSSSGPSSIVFVIDHSSSMMGLGSVFPGRDTWGARFRATRDLIDSIARKNPETEVSIVVFREKLYFDHRNNSQLTALPGHGDQSYLPLLKLNEDQGNGQNGKDIILELLQTDTTKLYNINILDSVKCVDLIYKPDFYTMGNTNINVAMEAAKEALKKASNPKSNQFIIFFSDGDPFPIATDGTQNGIDPYIFVKANDMATTFSVYFSKTGKPLQSLIDMTKNVQNNKYSKLNPLSKLWTIDSNYDSLMILFQENIISNFILEKNLIPNKLNINGSISTTYNKNIFQYQKDFPLEANLTFFSYDIDYTVTNSQTGEIYDTVTHPEFWVKRKNGVSMPDEFTEKCWERSMKFYYKDKPVSFVDETMENLEIRFTYSPGDAEYEYSKVDVIITGKNATNIDKETFNLSKNGLTFSKTFKHIIDNSNLGDNILQHIEQDSIIAFYQNPDFSLDFIRIAVPFLTGDAVEMINGVYFDNNADGYVDSIFVPIIGTFALSDLKEVVDAISLPETRDFSILNSRYFSGGIALAVKENSGNQPRTYVTASDSITMERKILPNGGLLIRKKAQIIDRVAPIITKGIFTPGFIHTDNTPEFDTLIVTYSEPVMPVKYKSPFNFYHISTKMPYSMTLLKYDINDDSTSHRYIVTKKSEFPLINDSIWIDAPGNVSDFKSNIQSNLHNRKAKLHVMPYQFNISIHAGPNPLLTNGNKIQTLHIKADILLINIPASITFEPYLTIYDVTGNAIRKDITGTLSPDKKSIDFIWDGKCKREKIVGYGYYLGYINITSSEGIKTENTFRIGVKKE